MSKKKTRKRMGRPPLPPGTAKTVFVTVRLSEKERKLLKAVAKRTGVSVSQLLMQPWREKTK